MKLVISSVASSFYFLSKLISTAKGHNPSYIIKNIIVLHTSIAKGTYLKMALTYSGYVHYYLGIIQLGLLYIIVRFFTFEAMAGTI